MVLSCTLYFTESELEVHYINPETMNKIKMRPHYIKPVCGRATVCDLCRYITVYSITMIQNLGLFILHLNPWHSDVELSWREGQLITYAHSCLEFVIPIGMTASCPWESQWFVSLLPSQVWASSSCPGLA